VNPFNRDSIERLSAVQEEPSWLTALRLAAWEAYERLSKDRPVVALDEVQAYAEPPRASVPSHEWPEDLKYVVEERGDEEGLIVQRDSTVLSRAITKESTKKGVIFTDLNTALRQVPELVQPYFAQQVKCADAFSALSTAFWSGGTFLYVPAHVEIQLPFHTCYWMTTPHSAVFPRTLVVAERGSIVTLIDDFLSVDWNQDAMAVSAVELIVREKAAVTYKQIHHWGRGVRHENRQMSSVAASGKLECSELSGVRPKLTLEKAAELYPEVRA
jgi:Fe-S cluster assembly scaffold protein SufB